MKKRLLSGLLLGILILFFTVNMVQAAPEQEQANSDLSAVSSEEKGGSLQEQISGIDLSKMQKFTDEINKQMSGYLPELNLKKMITDIATGKSELTISKALEGMLQFLFKEVVANFKLLLQLLILGIACAVLENLQGAFENSSTGQIAHAVVYLVLITIAIGSFSIALQTGKAAIDNMVDFMYAILPLLLTLLAALGNIASATIFHPLSFAVLGIISTVIKNVIFPLIFLSVVVGLITNISDKFSVTKLASFIRNIGVFLLGLLFTLFIGFLGIQGIGGSVADGVALRTAKFATGAFIPVVGKMFADAIDAVVGTSLLLKNAIGLVGVIIIFLLAIFPILKLLAIMFIYRFAAAIAQPVVNSKIVKCLEHMADSLTLVFAAVATVSLMFFFMVAIIVGTGNITVMLR